MIQLRTEKLNEFDGFIPSDYEFSCLSPHLQSFQNHLDVLVEEDLCLRNSPQTQAPLAPTGLHQAANNEK